MDSSDYGKIVNVHVHSETNSGKISYADTYQVSLGTSFQIKPSDLSYCSNCIYYLIVWSTEPTLLSNTFITIMGSTLRSPFIAVRGWLS